MQQFTVPQFIDVEDKIIGPITSRQFVIILGTFFLIALNYKIFYFSLFLTVSVPEFGLAMIFSFIKVNGRPFHFFVLNAVQTTKRAKLRIWNGDYQKFDEGDEIKAAGQTQLTIDRRPPTAYQTSRLEELSLIVDTQGAYKGKRKITDN